MELKPGYKQTEVGVIPEDWDVRSLQDLCKEEITYGIVQCGPHVPGGIPYIRVSDMDGPILDREKMLCTSSQIASRFRRSEVQHGDIIYALRGRLGDVRPIPLELDGANLTQGTARLSPSLSVHGPFLLWALRNPEVVLRACAESKGTTFMEITLSDLRQIKIALPPEPEQLRIASTLSDIEDHLMNLDLELAKKHNIKQAAMQELLTGKRRLPGFEGEWEVKGLGEIGDFLKGSGVKKDEAASGDLPCVRYGEIYTHHENYVSEFRSYISEAVSSRATAIHQGDILFAGSGETKEEIGKAVALRHPVKAFAGGDIVILRQSSNDALFLGYRLNANDVSRQKAGLGQGDAVVHISAHALSKIGVSLPGKAEQEAIAGILYEMDTELSQLQLRLAKTQELKQGMMQQLLTGKIRLT